MRKAAAAAIIFILMFSTVTPVFAGVPFQGYVYNFWAFTVPAPAAYIPVSSVSARDIDPSLGSFNQPSDVRTDINGYIYVLDSWNNRIVIFDRELNLNRVITGFYNDGVFDTFGRPQGFFITDELYMFIADTDNRRVVVLDQNDNLVRFIENPQGTIIPDDFDFVPLSVLVGRGDVVYVIARHIFQGIMVFDPYGNFRGYFGTIEVVTNPIDLIWRIFSTAAQRARQRLFIPTEFMSMDIDKYGFIFTTHHNELDGNLVMRLNPRGEDVLLNLNPNVYIIGDVNYRMIGPLSGPSTFVDIVARPYGKYSALDNTRGRVYTYDSEGNLLYVFAGTGNIGGMIHQPVAIETLGDEILVLDGRRGHLLFFEPTIYGRLINEAVALLYMNDEAGAVEKWRELIALDEHFSLAFAGIGRAHFVSGEYRLAMDYLRRGMDMRYYSLAFIRHRNVVMRESLTVVLTVMMAAIALLILYKIYGLVQRIRLGQVW